MRNSSRIVVISRSAPLSCDHVTRSIIASNTNLGRGDDSEGQH